MAAYVRAMPPVPIVAPIVAIVLPPKEGFSTAAVGAIGLLVKRHARAASGFRSVVFGQPQDRPFAGIDHCGVRPSWFPGNATRRYAGGLLRALRALKPDLVEVHNRPDVALFLAARLPLPVTLFLHNDPQTMRAARRAHQRQTMQDRLAGVVAVSRHIAERMPVPGRVAVLPNCLDLAELPPRQAVRDPLILFAGRVVADKGADSFVQACALALPQLPGWRAEMIGADRFRTDSADTKFLAALRPQAAAAGVLLHGFRPHADVLVAMARASLVVVPSRWAEPFGLTALEALATGTALLFAPNGGLPEVVGEAGVPIDPNNPAAMAAALVALARDPARRASLGDAGRARAARFDIAPILAKLDMLRRQTLDAWPRAASAPI